MPQILRVELAGEVLEYSIIAPNLWKDNTRVLCMYFQMVCDTEGKKDEGVLNILLVLTGITVPNCKTIDLMLRRLHMKFNIVVNMRWAVWTSQNLVVIQTWLLASYSKVLFPSRRYRGGSDVTATGSYPQGNRWASKRGTQTSWR